MRIYPLIRGVLFLPLMLGGCCSCPAVNKNDFPALEHKVESQWQATCDRWGVDCGIDKEDM